MRSLVVAKYVPWPPNSGDKRRTLGVLRALAARGPVTVCAFAGPDEDPAALEAEGIRVRWVRPHRSPLNLARGLLRGRSLTAARFFDPALAALVAEEAAATPGGVDALVVEHVQLLPYADRVPARVRVLDMHNIESSLTRRYADSQRGPRRLVLRAEAGLLRRLEARAREVDVVALVSGTDERLLAEVLDHPRVVVVPNAWEDPTPLPVAADPVVGFVALLSWAPNVDAATWFCRQVWPLVTDAVPEARLLLVGRNPSPEVRALAGPRIEVTGTVPDLQPWYARMRVAVAPLRAGGGSRLKILEALAFGRPVVATPVGVEGLEDLVGRGVEVGQDPAALAGAVVRFLRDAAAAESTGRAGAAAVAADHSWTAATRPLLDALDERLAKSP